MFDLYGLRKDKVLYDPLSEARRGGYGFVRSVDDGAWMAMTQAGASGYGLMVWSMAKSCTNCGDYVSQWLTPALVYWSSLTDPSTELVDPEVIYHFHHSRYGTTEPYGPMVGINQMWVPERYECYHFANTVSRNIEIDDSESDCMGSECPGIPVNGTVMIGLAPVVSIIPISVEKFMAWEPALKRQWDLCSTVLENYDVCDCSFEGWEPVVESCMVAEWETTYGIEGWRDTAARELRYLAESECTCSLHSFIQEWYSIVSTTPDFIDDKAHPDLFAAWRHLLDRYFTAWQMLDKHAPKKTADINERNAWVTYFSRRFSPYWGPTGLDEYLQEHGLQQFVA